MFLDQVQIKAFYEAKLLPTNCYVNMRSQLVLQRPWQLLLIYFHEIAPPASSNAYPEVDFLANVDPTKSESLYHDKFIQVFVPLN